MLEQVRTASKRLTYAALAAFVAVAAEAVYAQCNTGTREPTTAVHNAPYDARFTFVRLAYETGPGGYYYYGLPAWARGPIFHSRYWPQKRAGEESPPL